jgi:hypothetical protein
MGDGFDGGSRVALKNSQIFTQPFVWSKRSNGDVVQLHAMRTFAFCLALIVAPFFAANAHGRVVINEIMYHAPDDLDDLEFIELFNSGNEAVDISGWGFAKGVKLKFPTGTRIAAKGFVVVAQNADRLREFYGVQPVAVFSQKLNNHGERIELVDAGGTVMDAVHYHDRAPWPAGADGHSGSLERIDPESSGDNPSNWISSPLSTDRKRPLGTPGKPNAGFQPKLPPVISNVRFASDDPAPGQSVTVEAEVKGGADLKEVAVLYRLAGPGFERAEVAVPMRAAPEGHFSATIPGQTKDSLVRFRVRATDAGGNTRFYPAETEPRPALSYYVHDAIEPGKIPFAWIINTTPAEVSKARNNRGQFGFGPWSNGGGNPKMPFKSAFVTYDPATRKTQLFDFVEVNPRKGGRKVRFYGDQLFDGMKRINLIFEEDERYPLTESMAYEVYRRAGMPAEKSYHMRCWVNGQPIGYQLLVEQPDRGFLKRYKIRDDGNLYKLLWFGNGLIGQHAKKTNTHEDHKDLQALVDQLNRTRDREQWEVIKKNFDVEEVANYFAVNMVLDYWDGFFNNYFTYHDVNGTGKWTMYPWDQDKTWGITDGSGRVFYELPLTFGMNGDRPPFGQSRNFNGWWRPPGWFSGPLLANPYFRPIFLRRVKDIAENIYTEAAFFPLIDAMGDRLRDDVRIRAQIHGEDPAGALQRHEGNLNWMREHLKKRRAYLLAQKELQALPATTPTN